MFTTEFKERYNQYFKFDGNDYKAINPAIRNRKLFVVDDDGNCICTKFYSGSNKVDKFLSNFLG